MLVKITEMGTGFRASILSEQYSITIEQARELKLGDWVDIADNRVELMLSDGVVEEVE